MNAGIQGLAADMFKTALVRLDGLLEERSGTSRLVLQVHDEVLVEVQLGEEEEVGALTAQRAGAGRGPVGTPQGLDGLGGLLGTRPREATAGRRPLGPRSRQILEPLVVRSTGPGAGGPVPPTIP